MLHDLLQRSAERLPDAPAVSGPDRTLSYGELEAETNRCAHALLELGVSAGDRVALWEGKSASMVATMQACLRVGAAYVPIDVSSPVARVQRLLRSCEPRVLLTSAQRLSQLEEIPASCRTLSLDSGGDMAWKDLLSFSPEVTQPCPRDDDALAYILYTSGSTGEPKGVCVSHDGALSFVRWAAATVGARPEDHLSNHAPFQFDLSVFDLYVAFAAGAQVSLIPAAMAHSPARLTQWVQERGISIWYSVPSALMLMMDHGALLETPLPRLHTIVFAGEPFPLPSLRRLREQFLRTQMWNFYGPTETNVCTAYEVPDDVPTSWTSLPIGSEASGDTVTLVDPAGRPCPTGQGGEVMVSGPSVMTGYWGEPKRRGPYRTGDLARRDAEGQLVFLGRLDHLVKVRGIRIALTEVEDVLNDHPDVKQATVVVAGEGTARHLVAMVIPRGDARPGLLSLKRHCAQHLPRSTTVDRVAYVEAMPLTRNGKVDRRQLAAQLGT